jgi:hypothetical protein
MGYLRELLVGVLIAHQSYEDGSCLCGWNVISGSHAAHVADQYERAMAPANGSRVRQ